jgi:hypothetical protein
VPPKYLLSAGLPIAPATACSQDGSTVASLPMTGIRWPSCCSSARIVASACGEASVKMTCGLAAMSCSTSG